MVGGSTEQPDELEERLKGILLNTNYDQLDVGRHWERVKKKKMGGFLRSLNSPESVANQFTRYAFNRVESV